MKISSLVKENFGCGVPPNIKFINILEMEGISDINRNGQCPNPLDCGGVCSTFPRMTVGYILVGKYFSKLLWASSIPLRKQCCDTSGREILGKLKEVCGGRDTFGTSGSEWLLKKAEVLKKSSADNEIFQELRIMVGVFLTFSN